MTFAHPAQDIARPAAGDHEILGDHLDEIDRDRRGATEEIGIMRFAQPKAEGRNRHGRLVGKGSGRA